MTQREKSKHESPEIVSLGKVIELTQRGGGSSKDQDDYCIPVPPCAKEEK